MSGSNGWAPQVPLGEILTKNSATTDIVADAQYREVTVKLWGRGVVERRLVLGSEIAADRRSVIRKDQFILSRIDARNGATGIVPPELDAAIVSNDFPTFDAVPGKLLPSYLGWLSKTPGFVEACKRASEGTTNRVRLKEDAFLRQTIPLPPIEEQRRIVAKIERLAGKIEEARELAAGIKAKAAVFPTSLHANLSQGRMRRLDQLIVLDEDRVAVEPDRDFPQIGIRGFGGGLFHKPATRGSDTTYQHFNRIRNGQLVLSQVKGWEGAIAVATEEETGWFASPEYRTFTCVESECVPQYLDRIVRTTWFRSKLQTATRGQGARRERTRPEMLLSIEIPFPKVDQQVKAISWFDGLNEASESHQRTTQMLDAIIPAILDRAFRGELSPSKSVSVASTSTANQQLAKRAMVYIVMLLRHWNAPVARNVFDACLALMLNDQARKKILSSNSFRASSATGKPSSPLRGLDNLLGEMRVRQSVKLMTRNGQQFVVLGQQAPTTDDAPAADQKRLKETIAAFAIVGEDRAPDVLSEMIGTTYELAAT